MTSVGAGEHPSEPVDGALAEFRRRQSKRQAQAYAQFFSPVTRQFMPGLVRALGRPDGTALDLGCGDGRLTVALTGGGWDVLALDLSPDLAALARAGTSAPVVVGDARRLPLAGGRLAAVATAFVLPHLSELDEALAEAYRVLQAGGRLVLAGWAPIATSPFTGLASGLLRDRAAADQRARLVEAERRTDAGYLCARAEAAGFADIQLERLSTLVQLPSARVWWNGLVGASCGFGELYRSQTGEVQQETREAFAAAARAFERADRKVVVPAAALVLSGRRD